MITNLTSPPRPHPTMGMSGWTLLLMLSLAANLHAQSKTTFQDHVFPLIETHCARCHNPDKKKGDLDLTTYAGALKGGGSGSVAQTGNPDSSKLYKVITHQDEPTMPPNKSRLPDKELEVFKRWIADGLLETAQGKAVVASKPDVDLSVSVGADSKPSGPPPMPEQWPAVPTITSQRPGPILGIASSPWAPLLAVTSPKQVHLYHTERREWLGTLPFPAGQPQWVRFSRTGQLLLAAGGVPGKSGRAVIYDVKSGKVLATVGEELDTALAADISPDQTQVAIGGPSRLLRIHSLKTGQTEFKIKKHTDWITALAFSPNGKALCSGDRNGGLHVWDPDNGLELLTLTGHSAAIRSVVWRNDSKVMASISEDGSVRVWEMTDGKSIKNWVAHEGGGLSLALGDNLVVTGGRNARVRTWDLQGNKKKSMNLTDDFPVSVALSGDQNFIFAGTFQGKVLCYKTGDGTLLGELAPTSTSPSPRQTADAKGRTTANR